MKCRKIRVFTAGLVALMLPMVARGADEVSFSYKTESGRGQYRVVSEEERSVELTSFTTTEKNVELPGMVKDGEGREYTVVSVSDGALKDCYAASMKFPSTVTEIGAYTFSHNSRIRSVILPEGLKKIESGMFYWTDIEKVEIPGGLTTIGSDAFSRCYSLVSVSLPEGLNEIEYGAFSYCSELKDIVLPSSLTTLGDNAFTECTALEEITLPDGIKEIGDHTFDGCSAMKSFSMGEGVTSIGKWAFRDCNMLTTITLPSTLEEVGIWAFDVTGLREIYIKAQTPPSCPGYAEPDGTHEEAPIFNTHVEAYATLYVPVGAKEAYQDNQFWDFRTIKEIDFNEIANVVSMPVEQEGTRIYDLYGHELSGSADTLRKGIYVVVTDGIARKVMVP